MGAVTLVTRHRTIDDVLRAHGAAIAGDFDGYRNHVYRVFNLCLALAEPDTDGREQAAVAAVFHDLGIWTDRTFDYLEPSERLAADYLVRVGRPDWTPDVTAMIREHHKVFRYGHAAPALVEPFRRADWIDISRGMFTFGLPRTTVRRILSAWPNAGFHRRLVLLTLRRLRTNPLTPLPMMRL